MKTAKDVESSKRPFHMIMKDADQNSNFPVREAYKAIRTNLMFALPKTGCKKIIITSSIPKEGKSTSVINLAITLALAETRVLIIDCDMRKAFIHKFLKLKSIPGLSDVLVGMAGLSEVIQGTTYPSLNVICAGTIPPNPAELLSSGAMFELMKPLETKFDYILLDTPPVNVVADALALTKIADGVIMIARQGEVTHPEFSKALSSLEFVDAKVLGVILNDLESKGVYSRYRYGKKGKYYGYYDNKEAVKND